MSTEWDGKTRGTVSGIKVFVFFIKNFGVNAAYLLMHLPIPYFILFSRKNSSAIYTYFRERLNQSAPKSWINVYRLYFEFGKTIVDRIAISSKVSKKYSFEFDGEEVLNKVLSENKGGILISGHVGNFEMAQHFFRERRPDASVSIVITDQDHEDIKDYLQQYLKKDKTKFIFVKDDLTHIFEIYNALQENRIVCISGDRYMAGTKTIEAELLGKTAKFPVGPFHIATKLNVPVLFVYVMREPNKHYHLYARSVNFEKNNPKDLLEKYTEHMERVLTKYPLQWFNFYDFWEDKNAY